MAPIWLHDALFATDLPLWAVLRLSPRVLAPIFDARPELTAQMTATEAVILDTGGHLLLGHHDEVRQRIAASLATHVPAQAE